MKKRLKPGETTRILYDYGIQRDRSIKPKYYIVKFTDNKSKRITNKYSSKQTAARNARLMAKGKSVRSNPCGCAPIAKKNPKITVKSNPKITVKSNPYKKEYSCRLISPREFDKKIKGKVVKGEARRKEIYSESLKKHLTLLLMRKKGSDAPFLLQSFRYPKNEWTKKQAQSHCRKYGGTFEA